MMSSILHINVVTGIIKVGELAGTSEFVGTTSLSQLIRGASLEKGPV